MDNGHVTKLMVTVVLVIVVECDTGHDLRRRGHSYQLVCYNFCSTRCCFVIRMLYDSL